MAQKATEFTELGRPQTANVFFFARRQSRGMTRSYSYLLQKQGLRYRPNKLIKVCEGE